MSRRRWSPELCPYPSPRCSPMQREKGQGCCLLGIGLCCPHLVFHPGFIHLRDDLQQISLWVCCSTLGIFMGSNQLAVQSASCSISPVHEFGNCLLSGISEGMACSAPPECHYDPRAEVCFAGIHAPMDKSRQIAGFMSKWKHSLCVELLLRLNQNSVLSSSLLPLSWMDNGLKILILMHLAQRCLSQTYLVLFWGNFSLSVLPSQSVCAFPSLEHQSQRVFCLFSSKIPHYSLQACEAPLAPKLWYASSLTPSCVKT